MKSPVTELNSRSFPVFVYSRPFPGKVDTRNYDSITLLTERWLRKIVKQYDHAVHHVVAENLLSEN